MTHHPWITTSIGPDLVRGAVELEHTPHGILPHRLPGWARAQWPDSQLLMAEGQPSGVRLMFHTEATVIELDTVPTKRAYAGMPPRPDGIYDLLVEGQLVRQGSVQGGHVVHIDMARGTMETETGSPGTLRFADLPAGPKDVEIWLPHNETTELVALRSDGPLTPLDDTDRTVWLHHGSSISHGSNAEHPTGTWPAIAARLSGVSLINLGFGGSALLDPFVARTIRDLPADMISVKLGINLVNTDAMRLRAFGPAVHGFLDTIREGHPSAPLLVVSPILCPIHEETPGPTAADFSTGRMMFQATGKVAEVAAGKLTLNIVRQALAGIVEQRAASDPHLHYLDGRALYGIADHAALPLPDGLHPDAATHRIMGERFADLAFSSSGPLKRSVGRTSEMALSPRAAPGKTAAAWSPTARR